MAVGPVLFIYAMSDLQPLCNANKYFKYADDLFVVIPATAENTMSEELLHIAFWASINALHLNKEKTKVIKFYKPRYKQASACANTCNIAFSDEIVQLEFSDKINIQGVTLQKDLNMSFHISNTIKKCNRLFYALRMLKASGMDSTSLRDVFNATIVFI